MALDAQDHVANCICTKGNVLGDSWACCQAPGPLLSLHPPNGGLQCGLVAAVPGTHPLAVGILPLPKPFFPSAQGKQHPAGTCLQHPSHCRHKAYILLIYTLHIYILGHPAPNAVGSGGWWAQRGTGLAPLCSPAWHPAQTPLRRQLLHLTSISPRLITIETECCTHIP